MPPPPSSSSSRWSSIWGEPLALLGADAVLVTHEHADEVDVLPVAGLGVPVYTPSGRAISHVAVIEVKARESSAAPGFQVAGWEVGTHPSGPGRSPVQIWAAGQTVGLSAGVSG